MSHNTPPAQDFAATLAQLEAIVERLESGELSLEDALTSFEQGVRLTRDAQQRLDQAELKVRALSEDNGRLDVMPFAPSSEENESKSSKSEETPPW